MSSVFPLVCYFIMRDLNYLVDYVRLHLYTGVFEVSYAPAVSVERRAAFTENFTMAMGRLGIRVLTLEHVEEGKFHVKVEI